MNCQVDKNEHFRHYLFFAFNRGTKATEAAREICAVYGDGAIANRTAQDWFSRFKTGNFDLKDASRSGRPSEFDEERLNLLLHKDVRQTTRELAKKINCDQSTVVRHLKAMGKFRCRITPEVMAKKKKVQEYMREATTSQTAAPTTTSSSCFDASPTAVKVVESEETLTNTTSSNSPLSNLAAPQQVPKPNGRSKLAEARQQQMQQFAKLSSSSVPSLKKETSEKRQSAVTLSEADLTMARGGNITVTEAVEAFCNKMLKMEEEDIDDSMDQEEEEDSEFNWTINTNNPLANTGSEEDCANEEVSEMTASNEDYNTQLRGDARWSNNLSSCITKPKKVQRIKCRKCNEMVNITGGCLMHHVNTRHLKLPLFRCTQCPKDFFEVSNTSVLKHMRLNHNNDTSFVETNYHNYSQQLHQERDNCFGPKEERSRIRKMRRYMEKKNAAAVHLLSAAPIHPKPAAAVIPSTMQRLMKFEEADQQQDFPSPSSGMNSLSSSPYIDPFQQIPSFSAQLASLSGDSPAAVGSAYISNEDRAQCRVCGEKVWNRVTNRLNHVNVRHLHIPLYQCKLCGKTFESFSRSAVYSHITFAHREIVEDRKEAIEEAIVSMKDANAERLQDECNNYFC